MAFDLTGLGSLFDFASKVIDRVVPDPAQKAAAQLEVLKLSQSGALAEMQAELQITTGQLAINQEEAKSTNWLIAGARPFILWGCGFAMLYAALFEPIARFVATVAFHYTGTFPVLDTTVTTQTLFCLLGIGGMRTIEKLQGAQGNH